MTQLSKRSPTRRRLNVVAVGDSLGDRAALLNSAGHFSDSFFKNVLFLQRPTVLELTREVETLTTHIGAVAMAEGSFDLRVPLSWTAPPPAAWA